jgi:hypothetical protein
MAHNFSYPSALRAAERVAFKLDDVLSPEAELDYTQPFLPEGLAGSAALTHLSPRDRLLFNQVRGYSYLSLFGLVEEFILPFVLDHARADLGSDDTRTRALLNFASEEAKHIALFKRFASCFERGFGVQCGVIGPAPEITRVVLGHSPLAVALLILQIEWMTQRHYVDSVHRDGALDPKFKSLLKNHWLEEAQHAKLDTLVTEQIASQLTPRQRAAAVEEYLQLVAKLRDLLDVQLGLDLDSFERARERALSASERERVEAQQRAYVRWTFLGSGMTHPQFLETVSTLSNDGVARVRALAEPFQQPRH